MLADERASAVTMTHLVLDQVRLLLEGSLLDFPKFLNKLEQVFTVFHFSKAAAISGVPRMSVMDLHSHEVVRGRQRC